MNLNLIGYLLYIPITFYITVIVGKKLFNFGDVFLIEVLGTQNNIAAVCNRLLITGYYLLNLGYASVSVITWASINSLYDLIHELSLRLGLIILGLALIHYFNMFVFLNFSSKIKALYS
ncbi:MAG: hypothetical protein MUE96_09835 [Bacteroidia bacterium]|nr:hypothetical protein [Bacteroidia bacterium]